MMFFKKPKGWAELSKEDRAWAKTLKKGNSAPMLEECARDNQVSRLRYILDNNDIYQLKSEHFKAAVSAAVRKQSVEALKFIYERREWGAGYTQSVIIEAIKNKSVEALKFIYDEVGKKPPEFFDKWQQSFGVFTAASGTGSRECWDIVWAGNDTLPPRLRMLLGDIAEVAVKCGFAEAYHDVLGKKAAPDDTEVFEKALIAAAKKSPGALIGVLSWKERFPGAQGVIDDLFCAVAGKGDIASEEVLLGAGVDVNHGNGRALTSAAKNGMLGMVKFLAEKGADVRACADIIPALFNGDEKQAAVGAYLDSFFDGRYQKAHIAANARADENKNFSLMDKDTLAEKKRLPSGGTLTILFNFALRQQTVIAQDVTAKKETMMALQVTNFCDLESAALERAEKKFIELDGDPQLTEALKIRKTGLTRE